MITESFLLTREANITEPENQYHLNRRVNWELDPNIYNRTFNTTIYSPKEIELIDKDYKTMYSWILANKDSILECVKERRYIDTLSIKLPNFKTANQTFLPQEIEEFKHIISEYKQSLGRV